MFLSILGLTQSDTAFLRDQLLEAARSGEAVAGEAVAGEAVAGEADHYGERYQIDFPCQCGSRQAVIRRTPISGAWIILHVDRIPRPTSVMYQSCKVIWT